ncbi:MAG: hypothetical protein LBB14_00310, partial [Puniceicoccales bacterium]|nr:hypothetical protein [Puniceicoccales bacterium]
MGWRGRVLGLFCALSLVAGAFAFGWDWDAALLWDGEHVAVGSKFGKAKERISLTAVRPFGYGAFSCGMDGRLMEGAFGTNRLSPRVDYHIGIEGLCYIDFGYQHNFYFRVEEGKRHSNEVHGTAHFGSDFLLESGIVYKVEERDFNVWLFTSRTGSMAPFGVNFLSLRSSICIGYDCCFHPKGLMNY